MPSAVVAPKLASESRTDSFDFSPYLAAGQTIASASGVCSVYSGTDASPSAVLSSVAVSSPTVSAKVAGGVTGTIYQIRLDAVTATPSGTLSLSYFLAVIPDLP